MNGIKKEGNVKMDSDEALQEIRNVLNKWNSSEECLQSRIEIDKILKEANK